MGAAPGGRAPAVNLSGGLYGTVAALSSLSLGGLSAAATDSKMSEAAIAIPLPMLVLGIVMMVFVYKMWSSINDGQTKPTPGAAVGLLFIPIFSIYWVFVVWPGFASAYNAYCQRHRIQAEPLSMVLPLCALLFGFVPLVGIVLWFLTFTRIARAVNALSSSAPAR